MYQFSSWIEKNYIREHRHYSISIEQDLFGDWMVHRQWGANNSRRGGSQKTFCEQYEDALGILAQADKVRLKRGYISL